MQQMAARQTHSAPLANPTTQEPDSEPDEIDQSVNGEKIGKRIRNYRQRKVDHWCGCGEKHLIGCWAGEARKTKQFENQIIYL